MSRGQKYDWFHFCPKFRSAKPDIAQHINPGFIVNIHFGAICLPKSRKLEHLD
jgi:hypothetical protein